MRKWYRYVFWFLLNICVCNAHILECVHRGNNKRKQLQFRLALTKQLIGNFCQRKRPAPGAANRSPLQHISAKFEGRKKQCVQYKIAGRKTEKGYPVETKTKCTQCGIALCPVRCFREYHDINSWMLVLFLKLIFICLYCILYQRTVGLVATCKILLFLCVFLSIWRDCLLVIFIFLSSDSIRWSYKMVRLLNFCLMSRSTWKNFTNSVSSV